MMQFSGEGHDTAVRTLPGATGRAPDQLPTAALPAAVVVVVGCVDVVVLDEADCEGLELHAPATSAVRTSVSATAAGRPRTSEPRARSSRAPGDATTCPARSGSWCRSPGRGDAAAQ